MNWNRFFISGFLVWLIQLTVADSLMINTVRPDFIGILIMYWAVKYGRFLGTVSGMNTTFSGMADASSAGPSSVIAEGVSEALITTSTGLMIAIPSYIILFYLWVQYRRLRHGFRLIESRLSE